MNNYKALHNQVFTFGEYSLVPIRMEDRYAIMQWRNDQLYHLRQKEPLSKEQQDWYFNNVVASLFDQEKPDQILFSFLKNGECIGYGGLVHINWLDRNAEISFLMDTSLEKDYFNEYWGVYLRLIEQVAFNELNLHKIYTWAFDFRPKLYKIFEIGGYSFEAKLLEHCKIDNNYFDVIIHRKFNKNG